MAVARAGKRRNKLDPSLLADDITFLIAKARSMATAMANQRLNRYDLDLRMYSVLSVVKYGDGPSQRELADFLVLDARQVMYVIDALESSGLVERTTDPADRRSNIIRATEKGLDVVEKAELIVRQVEEEYLAVLDPDQVQNLRTLLNRVVNPPSGLDED
ncbi:MarR family winged helix-turn-helix transcriptional regulator [Arthrobacter sp. I2-34]|uniref:MarR family winged helix-turn-helix transcriptional regulator n=1 Tax=Arthrobacter hankyongi TaxID=2904801 RepID=A0ABS9L7I7_9MICC|nr:MarR family winged helix-turn-helix transcriptional regulator [Arthrobacter hankyongi]MCG2622629.1 MarR family winged helix-turn-helix transcriptional regulator [Arthrobacter hankyongi]